MVGMQQLCLCLCTGTAALSSAGGLIASSRDAFLSCCWLPCAVHPAGKTTILLHAIFKLWHTAHSTPGSSYRCIFVTASPTLKQQVEAAFCKLQVRQQGCAWPCDLSVGMRLMLQMTARYHMLDLALPSPSSRGVAPCWQTPLSGLSWQRAGLCTVQGSRKTSLLVVPDHLQMAALKADTDRSRVLAARSRQYHTLSDVPDAAFPLFLSSRQYLAMLDASVGEPFLW